MAHLTVILKLVEFIIIVHFVIFYFSFQDSFGSSFLTNKFVFIEIHSKVVSFKDNFRRLLSTTQT